jgi:hypothetical protein
MFYYRMNFVSLDDDVVDVGDSLNHCCCNVSDDLYVVGDDDSFYLYLYIKKMYQKQQQNKTKKKIQCFSDFSFCGFFSVYLVLA